MSTGLRRDYYSRVRSQSLSAVVAHRVYICTKYDNLLPHQPCAFLKQVYMQFILASKVQAADP